MHACTHARAQTDTTGRVRVKTRRILVEYPEIRFLSGRRYKFRCMRVSIHGPLYILVTFELSTCSESSVCNVNARFRGSTRSAVSGSLVQGGGNSISPYLDRRKTFVKRLANASGRRRAYALTSSPPIGPLLLIGY